MLLLGLGGCAAVGPADDSGRPTNALVPECSGLDDAAFTSALGQIDAAWNQGLERLDVLAIGLGSGCRDECFACWESLTDFVYFELH